MAKDEYNHFLVEYQASQNSAQHHDNLIVTVSSLMWGASLILLGFIFGQLTNPNVLTNPNLRILITLLSVLGILLCFSAFIFALRFNKVMNQKYRRCKDLEKKFGFKQHSKLRFCRGINRIVYGFVMLLFIATWVIVIWLIWSPCVASAFLGLAF